MSPPGVFFYVQHLLGIGHLTRAITIAKAMKARGLAVTMVSGGEPVPVVELAGLDFVQLPPTRAADKSFKVLLDESGNIVDEAWKARRRDLLRKAFLSRDPRVLLIELFPFGRRQMRFELIPLLEAAQAMPRPVTVTCSVRDILVEKAKPERNDEMVAMAKQYFDAVLVHGDPDLVPLDASFPHARELGARLRYTGYVVDRDRLGAATNVERRGVVVSAGGGAVGDVLLRTALECRLYTRLAHEPWRLLAGHNMPDDQYRALRADAPKGVIVERARSDFVTLLKRSMLSISQGGYNTVMEVLATGTRGVIVPYAGGEETEQTIRCGLLAERGLLRMLDENTLTVEALAREVDAALDMPQPQTGGLRLDGARATADMVAELAGLKPPREAEGTISPSPPD